MARQHEIAPLPENMVWGYLDAAVPPVLTVASGDTVRLTRSSSVRLDRCRRLRRVEPLTEG